MRQGSVFGATTAAGVNRTTTQPRIISHMGCATSVQETTARQAANSGSELGQQANALLESLLERGGGQFHFIKPQATGMATGPSCTLIEGFRIHQFRHVIIIIVVVVSAAGLILVTLVLASNLLQAGQIVRAKLQTGQYITQSSGDIHTVTAIMLRNCKKQLWPCRLARERCVVTWFRIPGSRSWSRFVSAWPEITYVFAAIDAWTARAEHTTHGELKEGPAIFSMRRKK